MNRIPLPGCRTEPLGSYLAGLGVWRAVVRLLDPQARAHWENGALVLTTDLSTVEELARRLAACFEPLPVVSPWNSGSGFAGNGKSASAERLLARVRDSEEPKLRGVKAAVLAADAVVTRGRELGYGGKGEELWDKAHKKDVIALARNLLPDDALPWLDAAVVLGRDGEPSYSRLLGTGGNFGRQDLSATYLARALAVVGKPNIETLRAALTGDESQPYERDAVGQFDPGRAGGVQSSPWEKADDRGFVNPWTFLLTVEGAVLFAASVVRRFGANTVNAAVPFVVAASTEGTPDAAAGERALGEIWTPQWERPAALPEIEQLLAEGRAEWRGSAARTGLDFVRAVSSLGVDRGLSQFTRNVVVERLGQNPLAIPAGVVRVSRRPEVRLLADLDGWLSTLRGRDLPAAATAGLRAVDAAQFAVAAGGGAAALTGVVLAVGALHDAVARSGTARKVTSPLLLRRPTDWLDALDDNSRELRLATALASSHDDGPSLRELLTPVIEPKAQRRPQWSNRPSPVETLGALPEMIAAAHRRRALPGVVAEPETDIAPAVGGVLSGFRYGLRCPLADVAAFVMGEVDDNLIADLLRGLMLADWSGARATPSRTQPFAMPPTFSLLAPFFATGSLRIRLDEVEQQDQPLLLRPGANWIPLLQANRVHDVVADARCRLAITGIPRTVRPAAAPDGRRLAAGLLVPISDRARIRALRAVADLPEQPQPTDLDAEPQGDAA